jgi:flagellar protein FliO/FliZ
MIGLFLNVMFSLAVVLGLMWVLARVARRPLTRAGGPLTVLARQQLTRGAAVAVVRVGERALVVGITEQQVTLLGETDPEAVVVPAQGPEVREKLSLDDLTGVASGHRTAGSALSPATWRQAVAALRRGRTP